MEIKPKEEKEKSKREMFLDNVESAKKQVDEDCAVLDELRKGNVPGVPNFIKSEADDKWSELQNEKSQIEILGNSDIMAKAEGFKKNEEIDFQSEIGERTKSLGELTGHYAENENEIVKLRNEKDALRILELGGYEETLKQVKKNIATAKESMSPELKARFKSER